jgi:HupE / UreJ protein
MDCPFDRARPAHVRGLLALLLLAAAAAPLSAHNVTPEPVVDVYVRPAREHLLVQVRAPIGAFADANLPRTSDGHLALDQIGPALDLVARGFAGDLEFQQGDDLLPMPAITSSISSDEASTTLDFDYLVRADPSALSARFHPFLSGGQVIRTIVHYGVEGRAERTFSIGGDPVRVRLDPSPGQALQYFVARGTDALLNGGDFLLFALCLIAPIRRKDVLVSACAALVAGETLSIALAGAGRIQVAPAVLLSVQAFAASAIVVTAIQALTSPRSRWLPFLALGVGLVLGLDLGTGFEAEASFAGAHLMVGLLALLLVVAIGQVWLVALLASAAALLRRGGGPASLAVLALALFAGHSALHRLADRAQLLADGGSIAFDRFLLMLTLAWAGAILCAGISSAVLFTRSDTPESAFADGDAR